MPDLISRYLSNVLTIDQIETITNKFMDGDNNTFTDIGQQSLKKITDKAKLPDEVVYSGSPYTQSIKHHTDINVDGVMDGQVLKWNASQQKWVNVTPAVEALGDITGAANLTGTGSIIFASEVAGILNFYKIRSMSTPLNIANSGNEVQFTLADATTIAKGAVQLATDNESAASKALNAADPRLTNTRVPSAHASNHVSGGSDQIKLDDLLAPDDNTDLNASTLKHGLMMKYPNNTTQFLRADGSWQAPPVPSVGVVVLKKEVAELYISADTSERTLISHSVGGGTLGTNGVLRLTVGGDYYNNTSSSEYLGMAIKIDNEYLWGEEVGSITNQANPRAVSFNATINQANAANAQKCNGLMVVSDDHAPSIAGYGGQDDDEGDYTCPIKGNSYIDWSTAHTVAVVAWLSSSSGSHTFTRDLAMIEQC